MKKLSLLIIMLLIAGNAFAGGQRPPAKGTYHWYLNEPYNVCAAYGHPWVPNKPPVYQEAEWRACAKPYMDYAFGCFKNGKKVNCDIPNPA